MGTKSGQMLPGIFQAEMESSAESDGTIILTQTSRESPGRKKRILSCWRRIAGSVTNGLKLQNSFQDEPTMPSRITGTQQCGGEHKKERVRMT
mmetsp:Transcript_43577/g.113493  ORF Transcript_43577/g.113493 Transcript_43577/m.113493 type:complete len:93 (+) Transcript_43577:609-887(+)